MKCRACGDACPGSTNRIHPANHVSDEKNPDPETHVSGQEDSDSDSRNSMVCWLWSSTVSFFDFSTYFGFEKRNRTVRTSAILCCKKIRNTTGIFGKSTNVENILNNIEKSMKTRRWKYTFCRQNTFFWSRKVDIFNSFSKTLKSSQKIAPNLCFEVFDFFQICFKFFPTESPL